MNVKSVRTLLKECKLLHSVKKAPWGEGEYIDTLRIVSIHNVLIAYTLVTYTFILKDARLQILATSIKEGFTAKFTNGKSKAIMGDVIFLLRMFSLCPILNGNLSKLCTSILLCVYISH